MSSRQKQEQAKGGRRWLRRITVLFVLLAIGAALGLWWLVRSEWFANQVRESAIAAMEKATGGRAEIRGFQFDPRKLSARFTDIVLRGKESNEQEPLLTVAEAMVDLKLVSLLRRDLDLESIVVRRPRFHLIVYPDGSTNLPSPKERVKDPRTPAEVLLSMEAGRLEVDDGLLRMDERQVPFRLNAAGLRVKLAYEKDGPRYRGQVGSSSFSFASGSVKIERGRLETEVSVEKERLLLTGLKFGWRDSQLEASGELRDWRAIEGTFQVNATLPVADAVATLGAPLVPKGSLRANGVFRFRSEPEFDYRFEGELNGSGLAVREERLRLEGLNLRSPVLVTSDGLEARSFEVQAVGSRISGRLSLDGWKELRVSGRVDGLTLRRAADALSAGELPWDGVVSGPFEFRGVLGRKGLENASARANVNLGPLLDSPPVEGHAEAAWLQREQRITVGPTYFATPSTRIDVSGTVGSEVELRARSSDLNDLLPLIRMAGQPDLQSLPVTLRQGRAELSARLQGPLDNPTVTGRLTSGPFRVSGQDVDRLEVDFVASQVHARAQRVSAVRGSLRVEGDASAALNDWRLTDGAISGRFAVRGVGLAELARDFGSDAPVSGIADGTVTLSGSAQHPIVQADFAAAKLAWDRELFTNVRVQATHEEPVMTVARVTAGYGPAALRASGVYRHQDQRRDAGTAEFQAAWEGMTLSQFRDRQWWPEDLEGISKGELRGVVSIDQSKVTVARLDGDASLDRVRLGKEPVGALALKVETANNWLRTSLIGNIRESKLQGSGEWPLLGSRQGAGQISFTPISLLSLQRLRFPGAPSEDPQFEGATNGAFEFDGSLNDFAAWKGKLTLQSLRINAKADQVIRLGADAQDLTFATATPVTVLVDRNGARIERAELVGRNSRLSASGTIAFGEKGQSDLAVKGNLNLVALQLFNPDLLARGMATVDATVRGTLAEPLVNGRLRLQNASLYVTDLPTGIDNVNGSINFSRQRATIESLVAEIGGGSVRLGGFLDFGGRQLGYRVTAQADNVRIRYPEDVSVTMDGLLTLTGTSQNSLVSGNLTIVRASFQPKTDLGGMLAASSGPTPVPTTNEYLRGMQFDIRIDSSQELRVTTSLTRELQVEAELRLRGSPARPVLLGTVSVTRGQIQVFGNDYRVNRGEIRFFNPVKIEPVFDADLETKARGVTVNISFSGPLSRLNVTYRSDPPLQSREIIALLAVGRDPQLVGSTIAQGAVGSQSAFLQSGANSLLGQAVSQQLSSRLQRFFGVSRIKIDPQLTGLDNLPQARLTLEQQVSKEITLTYITNLNRAQEQIIRVQWDVDRNWSFLATRDANGLFGIDILFRKAFR